MAAAPHLTRRDALVLGGGALGALGLGWGAAAPARADGWPSRRGDPAAIRERFGARGDMLGAALRKGDPLADAVVEELRVLGPAARQTLQAGSGTGSRRCATRRPPSRRCCGRPSPCPPGAAGRCRNAAPGPS